MIDSIGFFVNSREVRNIIKEELVALLLSDVFLHGFRHVVDTFDAGECIELGLFLDVLLVNLVNVHETIFGSCH